MRVLEIASEAVPFAKTGGLADVAGALPEALARLGCDVTLVIPAYAEALSQGLPIEPAGIEFDVPIGSGSRPARILRSRRPGQRADVLLVANDELFDRPTLYGGPSDYLDNAERFIFFSRAAVELACRLGGAWDILHGHDWQTGLVPAYRRLLYGAHPAVAKARTVITIHNLAYQGLFWHWDMLLTGIGWNHFTWREMEFYGQLNLLKTGIVFADAVSTVSPTYAREIQATPGGCGLEGLLAARRDSLVGIVNGIDTDLWDPARDPHLPRPFGPADAEAGKRAARAALAARLGRPLPDGRPLVAFVGRLVEQKGITLILEAITALAGTGRMHFVTLGTGGHDEEAALRRVAAAFPQTVDVVIGFDEGLSHLVQAAADITLVPSRFEPCGLTQLYAQRYGSIPVVRATGGLVDTVVDATPEAVAAGTATGFVFREFTPAGLIGVLERAVAAHVDRPLWRMLVGQAMRQDWSWQASGREYVRLFERTVAGG
jgi:starch synthase